MTIMAWETGYQHHPTIRTARRTTVLLQPAEGRFRATLIGDHGVAARFTIDGQQIGSFLQELQSQSESAGSLVVGWGWGLVATGGIGSGPIGPPGPVGEPPVVAAWNVNLHYQMGALAEIANAAKLG